MSGNTDSSTNQIHSGERRGIFGRFLLLLAFLILMLSCRALQADAAWVTNEDGTKKYTISQSPGYATGQVTIDGKKYYFNSKGVMQTGFVTINDKKYYFKSSGEMVTNKSFKVEGKRYRARKSGSLYTSRWYPKQSSAAAVYYQADGSMAVNTWVGSVYVGSNGRATGKTRTGWVTLEGNKYYATKDGKYKTGWFKVGKKTYYANSKGVVQTSTWVGNKYLKKSGAMATGKYTVGKKTYIFKSSGEKSTGWTTYSGKTYYCGKNGVVRKSKWIKNKYYVDADGVRVTGFYTIGNNTYYFNSKGVKQTGTVKVKGKLYRLKKSNGVLYKNCWISSKYYANSSGELLTGLNAVGGDLYYFKKTTGARIKDKKKTVSGDTYYFGSDGKAVKSKWVQIGSDWYYFQSTGKMAKSTYVSYNGVYYKVDSNGKRTNTTQSNGWSYSNGSFTYVNSDGKRVTGWQTIGSKKYYFNSSGVMQTGLQTIGGKKYYLYYPANKNSDGSPSGGYMVTSTTLYIGADKYKFDSNGVGTLQSSIKVSGTTTGSKIATEALKYVGNPYVYGGTSLTKGTDCSGFTMLIFAKYGITLDHFADDQMKGIGTSVKGTSVALNKSSLMPGDLIFYGSSSYASHVAIYIGDGQIVHASNSQPYPDGGIKISSYNYQTPVKAVRYWS